MDAAGYGSGGRRIGAPPRTALAKKGGSLQRIPRPGRKGPRRGLWLNPYPFSLCLQSSNSGVWGPEAGLGKEVLASLSGDGRSVCRGGMMAGLMNLNEEHATFRRRQWLALMTERWGDCHQESLYKKTSSKGLWTGDFHAVRLGLGSGASCKI